MTYSIIFNLHGLETINMDCKNFNLLEIKILSIYMDWVKPNKSLRGFYVHVTIY
jgi:hypothetical protein